MKVPQLDILAIGVHPDDVELTCSGTICRHRAMGYSVGVLDLTGGELGTRGNKDLRLQEAQASAKILGLNFRHNLHFRDGFFQNDEVHQLEVVRWIRALKPVIVMCNAPEDRHPDHGRAGALVNEACFYSGLRKIQTELHGQPQEPWRPTRIYQYVQDRLMIPSLVVDITPWMEQKMDSIKAYSSQFYNPESTEPESYISSPRFFQNIDARARTFGHMIGVEFGEGFMVKGPVEVGDFMAEM